MTKPGAHGCQLLKHATPETATCPNVSPPERPSTESRRTWDTRYPRPGERRARTRPGFTRRPLPHLGLPPPRAEDTRGHEANSGGGQARRGDRGHPPPSAVPVPGPVVGGGAVKGLHGRQQPLAGRHRGREADVFWVQRLVLVVFQLQWGTQLSGPPCQSRPQAHPGCCGDRGAGPGAHRVTPPRLLPRQ